MKKLFALLFVLLPAFPVFAVDDTASMLIAMDEVRLGDINDRIDRQYPDKKGVYWLDSLLEEWIKELSNKKSKQTPSAKVP